MGDEPLIRAEHLALGYGRERILDDVALEVRRGERWFLIGPNGSGKSTLLRAVLGLLAPRAGTLSLAPGLRDRSRIGFVPQRCEWTPTLPTTVREFVALGFVAAHVARAERAERLAWALALVGLEARSRHDYAALSGGQRQRALLARALVRRPALLLLDEPTEELDVGSEAALLATLIHLNQDEGTALVIVTHELELAAEHATHVALFAGGRVQAGPRDAVLDDAILSAALGGRVRVRVGGHA